MRLFVKTLQILGIIAGIVGIGILVGWWNTRMTSADSPQPIAGFREATNVRSATLLTQHSQMSVDATATTSPQPRPTAEPRSDLITNWEEQVQTILSSPTPDPDKANALLEIFPHVPEEGKSEVVATLVPLLPDSQFADLGQYLTNASTSQPVREVLMAGLLSRPDTIKLPWLLEIARTEENPQAADAMNLLKALLDQDNGKDWPLWQASIERHLRADPQ